MNKPSLIEIPPAFGNQFVWSSIHPRFGWNSPPVYLLLNLPPLSFKCFVWKPYVTRDDLQWRVLAQHSAAMLEQCCSYSKQCCNVTLRLKSSLSIVPCNITLTPLFLIKGNVPVRSWTATRTRFARSARAWSNVILEGKRDSRRHSTTGFRHL